MKPQRSKFKSAARTGSVAIASLMAAAAWRSFMLSAPLGYEQHITPAAWRFAR